AGGDVDDLVRRNPAHLMLVRAVRLPPDVGRDAHEVRVVAVFAAAGPRTPRTGGIDRAIAVGVERRVVHAEVVAELVRVHVATVAGRDHRPARRAAADLRVTGPLAPDGRRQHVDTMLIEAEVHTGRGG